MTAKRVPHRFNARGWVGSLLVGLLWLAAIVPSPARAASPGLRLTGVTEAVPHGAPYRFTVSITNNSSQSETLDLTVWIHPADARDDMVHFLRETQVIPAGQTVRYASKVTTARWFDDIGSYTVVVSTGEAQRSLDFQVTPSTVPIPRFVEVTEAVGLDTTMPEMECDKNWTAGAAWGDIEGDGDPDLFLPRRGLEPHLWVNADGAFFDEAPARGLTSGDAGGLGAVFADYDNDGDQDLYVNKDGSDRLFQNDGQGRFTDVSAAAGIVDESRSQSASWGDYDGDGWLDLYVTNSHGCPRGPSAADKLYHNEGDGTFSDRTDLLHVDGSTTGSGFQALWFDYDSDGDDDLYLANDYWGPRPEPSALWRNDGPGPDGEWVFRDISVESGTSLTINAMGIAAGDYDRDLDLDLLLSNIYEPVLLQNLGEDSFRNRAPYARIDRRLQDATSRAITWGTMFLDLNNDGWEDLYLVGGRLGGEGDQSNAVYTNERNGRFLDHSAPSDADDPGVGRGLAAADYDGDGSLDLFVVNHDGEPRLFRNVTPAGGRRWLGVDLVGSASNRDACGARLILTVGRAKLLRQVFCGGVSLASGSTTTAHFGLGRKGAATRLVISWPSGRRQVVRDLPLNRVITIEEPADG